MSDDAALAEYRAALAAVKRSISQLGDQHDETRVVLRRLFRAGCDVVRRGVLASEPHRELAIRASCAAIASSEFAAEGRREDAERAAAIAAELKRRTLAALPHAGRA